MSDNTFWELNMHSQGTDEQDLSFNIQEVIPEKVDGYINHPVC